MTLSEADIRSILDHMNSDHEDTLRNYVKYFAGLHDVLHAEMRDIGRHEMRIHARGHSLDCTLAIPLQQLVETPEDARRVLVDMALVARHGLQEEGVEPEED